MIGIIWTDNINEGNITLEQMIEDYNKLGINTISYMKSKYGSKVGFDNGDYWKVVRPSKNQRANKCNVAYIDRTINKEVLHTVIYPTLVAYPYSAYRFITFPKERDD